MITPTLRASARLFQPDSLATACKRFVTANMTQARAIITGAMAKPGPPLRLCSGSVTGAGDCALALQVQRHDVLDQGDEHVLGRLAKTRVAQHQRNILRKGQRVTDLLGVVAGERWSSSDDLLPYLRNVAEREGVTLFGVSAKYIDALHKEGLRPRDTHDAADHARR